MQERLNFDSIIDETQKIINELEEENKDLKEQLIKTSAIARGKI